VSFNYQPGPTGIRFMESKAQVKIICGPVGGGKSTVAFMELLRRATQQAPYKDGVRRSKAIILRNTVQQLKTTVKPLIDQWAIVAAEGTLGEWMHTQNSFQFRFALPDGTSVESDFMLMAADTPDDVRRLLSVEASWAWVEECREVDDEVFRGLRGRVNRYPNRLMGGVSEPGVICSTNPPPIGGFWHDVMTEPPKGWEVFMQPAAMFDDGTMNPDAENVENLAPGYYENLTQGATQEWIDVYIKNKFGLGNLGQPVFKTSFKRSFHVAKTELKPIAQTLNPLVVGMDNGLTAAAVITQMDARGRVNILGECYVPEGASMGVEQFMDRKLIPLLKTKFATIRHEHIMFIVDPACFQRSQVSEITIAQAIASRGFRVLRAATNDPERRIAAVEQLLLRQIDGGPGVLIGADCPWLADAMEWGYRFKRLPNGQMQATPEKNHHSHMADAMQYACMHYNTQLDPAAAVFNTKRREVKKGNYTWV